MDWPIADIVLLLFHTQRLTNPELLGLITDGVLPTDVMYLLGSQ